MAKNNKTKAADKMTTEAKKTTMKKPVEKKPVEKKPVEKKPVEKKIEPKRLIPDDAKRITLKKLANITTSYGVTTFLLHYDFDTFVSRSVSGYGTVEEDVRVAVCPDDSYVVGLWTATIFGCNPKKNEVILLIECAVEKEREDVPPLPVEAFKEVLEEPAVLPFKAPSSEEAKTPCAEVPTNNPKSCTGISVTMTSDDKTMSVTFDGVPWFTQATHEELVTLAEDSWENELSSDIIAFHSEKLVPEVESVIAYVNQLATMPDKADVAGFSCKVNSEQALKWLEEHRSDSYVAVLAAHKISSQTA